VLRLCGEVASRQNRGTEALEWFNAAFRLATELEMRPHLAHCHLGLGEHYRRNVELNNAKGRLQSALTMYEMGMQYWFERASDALASL
jgi:hypothetical protein